MHRPMRTPLSWLLVTVAVLLVAACGGENKKKPASQVAVKVNNEEISVHQINTILSRGGRPPIAQTEQASRDILEKLIDQELLVQKAVEKKLDRDPNVMQAMEAGRRQILAQAYLEQLTGTAAKPAPEEVKSYYEKHPELFSERRIFRFQEFLIAVGADQLSAVQEQVARSKSLNELVSWLKAKDIKFGSDLTTKAAEQLPMELLPRLHKMKDGEVSMFPTPKGLLIVQLVASQMAPLDLAAATPLIEQFTLNQRRSEMAAKEVSQIRAAAKIEYQGSFAKSAGESKPAQETTAVSSSSKDVSSESVRKGVAALK